MSEATQNQDPKPLSEEELSAGAATACTDPLADAQAELANLKAQNADLADQYLRAQADVQNARRSGRSLRSNSPEVSLKARWSE